MEEKIRKMIREELKERPGNYSLYFKDLASGENIFIDINKVYPAASIIKIPIIIEVFRQHEEGILNLDRLMEIPPEVKVDGSFVLQELRENIQFSIKDLAVLMIILSDNTATNILIDLLGMGNINFTIRNLGLKDTILQRKMMDFTAREAGKDNFTTARDIGSLLEGIYRGEIPGLSRSSTEEIFRILTRQVYRDNLSFYIPEKYWKEIGSKTGTLAGIIHDASIFALDQARYVLVMMSENLSENSIGKEILAKVSKLIFDYWK